MTVVHITFWASDTLDSTSSTPYSPLIPQVGLWSPNLIG